MKRKVIPDARVLEALTQHLRALSVIEDNEDIVSYYKVPEGLDVKVEKSHD